jgi:hypothetical protein
MRCGLTLGHTAEQHASGYNIDAVQRLKIPSPENPEWLSEFSTGTMHHAGEWQDLLCQLQNKSRDLIRLRKVKAAHQVSVAGERAQGLP